MNHQNWGPVVNKIKAYAKELYCRDLSLIHRIWTVQTYLLSQCWYLAQVLPLPTTYARQIICAISWYIWQGNIFRVPINTLYLQPTDGGLGLVNVIIKCQALFLGRGRKIQMQQRSFSSAWLQHWSTVADLRNPPDLRIVPPSLKYLRTYLQEWCYLTEAQLVPEGQLTRRIYADIFRLSPTPLMRLLQLVPPNTDFRQLWRNISAPHLPAKVRSTWYMVVHDIVPTKERLYRIRMSASDSCSYCGQGDSILHRLTSCPRVRPVYIQAQAFLQRIHFPINRQEQFIRPDYLTTPRTRQNSALWIIGHTIHFLVNTDGQLDKDLYSAYLKRTRWKIDASRVIELYGQYLSGF